jgi:hypothetical protein
VISRKTHGAPNRLISALTARATMSERRKRTLRVISAHEILAPAVAQNSTFATHRLDTRKDFAFGCKRQVDGIE